MLHYRELLQSLLSTGSLHSDTEEEQIFHHFNYYFIQILNFIKFLESNSFYRICSSNHIHNHVPHIHICTLKVTFSISATSQFFLCSLLYWHSALWMPSIYRSFLLSILKPKNMQDRQFASYLIPIILRTANKTHPSISKTDPSPNKAQLSFFPNNSMTPRSLWVYNASANRRNKCWLY